MLNPSTAGTAWITQIKARYGTNEATGVFRGGPAGLSEPIFEAQHFTLKVGS